MQMEPINKFGEVSFHGIDYIIKIFANNETLSIEIEQKNNGDVWKNSFSCEYIEEITQKTGNFKKFPVFVKMLTTSISKNSDSVFLDILTYQDLQVLKSRKQGASATNTSQSQSMSNTNSVNNKRYLIMTYVVEFDKVHYPLPLNFNENPDVESLKQTIKRLRTEIEEIGKINKVGNSTGNSFFSAQEKDNKDNMIASLRLENEYLKAKIKKNDEETYQKKGAAEYDLIIKGKLELENELENLKTSHMKEVVKLNSTIEELQKELQNKKNELLKLQMEFAHGLDHSDPQKRLTDHIMKMNEESESELFSAKKTLSKQEKELDRIQQELEMYKQNDKKQKIRIKQLEMDLESALKKTSVRGVTERLYSGGSRGNSPALSSKRSVSVPHRGGFSNEKKVFDRKNSSHLSTVSNKNKYSRENSVTSDSGYLSRWKRKNSPDVSKTKKTTVTPQRKLTGSSIGNSNSIKQKNYVFNSKTPKNSSNVKPNNNNLKNKRNENINRGGNSGKKDYEKPWMMSSKNKNASPLPKINNRNNSKNNKKNNYESSDDENALFRKLEELRNKNRKDFDVKNSSASKNSNNNNKGFAKSYNKENSENIDDRLNKLQNLLKIAKK